MNIKISSNEINIEGKEDFDIKQILECGQIFSFKKNDDYYQVLSMDKECKVFESDFGYKIVTKDPDYFYDFFDLETDYGVIKKELLNDDILKNCIGFGHGIRILKQNTFETIISFIISANNNIKRIQSILFKIRENFGVMMDGYYSFPTPERLASVSREFFLELGAGYRADYLENTAKFCATNDGKLLMCKSEQLSTNQLKEKLMSLKGVGPKVADCILLFGFSRFDVFPVDTWIDKVFKEIYKENVDRKIMRKILVERFGNLSGYAQQYLFYYKRKEPSSQL